MGARTQATVRMLGDESGGETDPLLTALIGKLPPGGASWPKAKRAAWLELMWKTFDLVYADDGGEEAIPMPAFLKTQPMPDDVVDRGRGEVLAKVGDTVKADPPFRAMGGHAFYIDKAGRACRAGGAQILASDVPPGATIYDMRGELGDLGAIEWADGKTGVRGIQVAISAA